MELTGKTGNNRLMDEKSPYLRQHADNPVDWFPWGDEAFKKARDEDKPILVSIGYATCHWCHVMADESFSDPETAGVMNDNLVSVKIDREERPDIDQIYITAVSALTGSAGWPLNVFLTPGARPFFGGTYFPARQGFGMASWKEVVEAVGSAWKDPEQRQKLVESAEKITEAVKSMIVDPGVSARELRMDKSLLDNAVTAFAKAYDPDKGGFSRAPKFPMPPVLSFLLFYYKRSRSEHVSNQQGQKALDMAVNTLEQMIKGGIYDHLGGGFHRYSTDASWHVPHFEKMLYDNAQMIPVLLEAYQITGKKELAGAASQTLDYISREMTHELGGFYSAEDADSYPVDLELPDESQKGHSKSEGAFYVWKKTEIDSVLDDRESEVLSLYYGVEKNGNVKTDPSGEFAGRNILYKAMASELAARHTDLGIDETGRILDSAAKKLYNARKLRPRPFRDEKILTEWNAMMISALVKAYRVFGEEIYLQRAEKAIDFIFKHLVSPEGRLFRRWADGQRAGYALAGDYAMLVQALLDLYEARMDPGTLRQAEKLGNQMLELFFDKKKGGFFMTAEDQDKHLIIRAKDFTDNVIASANSVAVNNCVRLCRLTNDENFYLAARNSFRASAKQLFENPQTAPRMLEALAGFLEVEGSYKVA